MSTRILPWLIFKMVFECSTSRNDTMYLTTCRQASVVSQLFLRILVISFLDKLNSFGF